VVLSVVFLLTVPVGAMVAAYGYGNGFSPMEDALRLGRDLARLLGGP
jgi:hypothetical protein